MIWYLWTDSAILIYTHMHQIPAVNLFIFNSIMMLNVPSVCSVWSNITKKTPENKAQHQERSTHKKRLYIYRDTMHIKQIYIYVIYLYKASHPKKSSLTESAKKRCWHVVTWSGPLCAFSSWPQTRLSRETPLAKMPEKFRLWEIVANLPRSSYMGVSKNREKYPKMDGL